MLLCILLLFVAASYAREECYNPELFIAKLKPIHAECRKKLSSLAQRGKDSCYADYRLCHMKALNIANDVNGLDRDKFIAILESHTTGVEGFRERFTACDHIPQTADKIEETFRCLGKYLTFCPGKKKVRTEFLKSAVDFCM